MSTVRAAVFPGQGAQKPGMGEHWRDSPAWSLVEEISDSVGRDVSELLLVSDEQTLQQTDNAQLSMFAMGVLGYHDAHLGVSDPEVVAFAGHSLGEYVALVAAGALSVTDGARLVAARGSAMLAAARRADSTMLVVVGADVSAVDEMVTQARSEGYDVWVANVNGPGQVVLSGTVAAIDEAATRVHALALRPVRISVGGAFHCPLMESACEPLAQALDTVRFAARHAPVVANVDGRPHTDGAGWRDRLIRQLTSPVLWHTGFRALVEDLRCDTIVEYGQAKTLTALAKRSGYQISTLKFDRPGAGALV
ncbi:ACP S-malonyltransferase [Nocardia sp. NPDC127579]|uniref:ACP S-malonyltransferase n=1 Tax=Nocardia sp. NPDC127579 TaxID=3345402 RepID=UPI00362636D6